MPVRGRAGVSERQAIPFEAAVERLEELVHTLERGDLTLADMVAAYEESVRLSQYCSRLLDEAELRVSQVVRATGEEVELAPLDLGAQALRDVTPSQ
jgi:exodeoxyribonuclease VII small subunit